MADDQDEANRRLEEALAAAGARDPREHFRARLRELKQDDAGAYEQAVAYYRGTLVPGVASGEADPLVAWTEYGRRLAELTAPGRTVALDAAGRAEPYAAPAAADRMVLHLPDGRRGKALLVALPPEPSRAQRAAYDLLVEGRQKLPESLQPRTAGATE